MMKILLRWTIALAILAMGLASLTFSDSFGFGPTVASAAEVDDPLECAQGSHVAVKLVDGVDIGKINSKYGTEVVRTFPGTRIYILAPPAKVSAKKLVRRMNRTKWFVWSEIGQYSAETLNHQGFSGARVEGFSQAALDQFSQAVLEQFSQAVLDQFTQAALEGFSQAALDGFSQAALEGFSQAALDGFTQAVLDQFSQAILEGFSQAALDQFSQAILEQFSQAALEQFTQAALEGFSQAALDQFTQAALEGFSQAALDGFTQAVLEQFTQAALEGFSVAALEGFSQAALDGFTQAVLDGFTQAVLDEFMAVALDGFTQAVLDGFTQAVLEQFTVAAMDQFTRTALDGFSAAILEQFSAAIMDQFTVAALEQFSLAALDQFTLAALDGFTQAILDRFTAEYFLDLVIDALDDVYGARAREQVAMLNINAPAAQELATGEGVVVAVVDTGISDHWYLRDRIAPGGYDLVDNDNDPTDELRGYDGNGNGLADEGWGHGTHVAGIVSLVAPGAKILPIRVQDSEGEAWSFIVAEGIEYAVDHGADVINVSMGVQCKSRALEYAVKYAVSQGVVIIAAAGNSNGNELHYPAAYTKSVAVAAVDNNDIKALFSNYAEKVTVSAPGVEIYSTYGEGQFAWWSGTSQATPMIAGEAALLLSVRHSIAPMQLGELILQSADDIDGLNPGYEEMLGGGRANLLAAVQSITGQRATSSGDASETLSDNPGDTSSDRQTEKRPKKKRRR